MFSVCCLMVFQAKLGNKPVSVGQAHGNFRLLFRKIAKDRAVLCSLDQSEELREAVLPSGNKRLIEEKELIQESSHGMAVNQKTRATESHFLTQGDKLAL